MVKNIDEVAKFIEDEYREAWTHYRHLENSRTQYLGFFFTVTLGSAAVAVPILTATGRAPAELILGSGAFLSVFAIFQFFAFVNVKRIGMVLTHYGDALTKLRARKAALIGIGDGTEQVLTVRTVTVGLGFGVQRTAEQVMVVFIVISAGLAGVSAALAVMVGSWFGFSVCLLAVAESVLTLVIISWTNHRPASIADSVATHETTS